MPLYNPPGNGGTTIITNIPGDYASKAYVDAAVAAIVPAADKSSGLLSGGQVVWETGYTYRVSSATYNIAGTQYTSSEQAITLDAADASNPRIDVLALNTSGTVVKITGTAAANPTEPDIDPVTQLQLTWILVGATTTQPAGAVSTILYAEGAGGEWTWTTSGTGFTLDSTSSPRTATKCILGTTVAAGAYAQGQAASAFDQNIYDYLILYIKSTAAWASGRYLRLQFQNTAVKKGNTLTLASGYYGFDSSNITDWQQVAIPISQFAVPVGTLVNQLRITDVGGSIGFRLDDISLQAGGSVIEIPPLPEVSQSAAIEVVIDGAGSAITTGIKCDVEVPWDCTITGHRLVADQTGSIVIDIWRDTYANYPPTDADSITASAPPTLSSAAKAEDLTLTGWSKTLLKGQWLRFNVDSAATLTRVTLSLNVTKA